jgi:single-strand DNA-binding protein
MPSASCTNLPTVFSPNILCFSHGFRPLPGRYCTCNSNCSGRVRKVIHNSITVEHPAAFTRLSGGRIILTCRFNYINLKRSIMIKMQIIGNLGKDCTVNTVNGKNVINFTVAHTEKYKDAQGNQQEKTTWVDCAYWTDRTALSPYLVKGKQVFAEGTPEVKTFSRQDGTAGASLTLRVREVQLLGGSGGTGANNGAPSYATSSASSGGSSHVPSANDITEPIDDLPF